MAGRGSNPEPKSAGRTWRGRERQTHRAASHRWQDRGGTQTGAGGVATTNRRPLRLLLFLTAFVAFLSLFVYYVLFAPPQTPLIVLTADAYKLPLEPNAWVREDVDRLLSLDGETLRLSDISQQWASREQGLRAFDQQLRRIVEHSRRSEALMIYVSMHGAVDGDGNPCLIPADAGVSPLESQSWLPVADLLGRIKAQRLPDATLKLVIFDCNRMQVNPGMGMLYNSFADQLEEVVAKAAIPNLVVLNSTSPGETGRISTELRGSVFGHFLQLGLAGEADRVAVGGNGNQRVCVAELHRYLNSEVDAWVRHHFGQRQRPMLIGGETNNASLVWSLTDRVRERIRREFFSQNAEPAAVKPAQIAQQWQAYERFRGLELAHHDPTTWKELQHKLLWLEQTAAAGRAYAAEARRTLAELQNMAAVVQQRFANGSGRQQPRYVPDGAMVSTVPVLEQLTVHSLPAAEALGAIADGTSESIRSAFDAAEDDAGAPQLNSVLLALSSQPLSSDLCEVHFLKQLQRYGAPVLWANSPVLARAASTRFLAERVAVPPDERVQYQIRARVDQANEARRAAEDALFSADASAPAQWETAAQLYAQTFDESRRLADFVRLRDRMLAELPYLAEWLARPMLEAERAAALDVEVNGPLLRVIRGVCGIDDSRLLSQADHEGLAADFARLRALLDEEYARLLELEAVDGRGIAEMRALLDIPLLPSQTDRQGRSPAQQRTQLHAAIATAIAALGDAPARSAAPAGEAAEAAAGSSVPEHLKRVETLWAAHPLLAIAESNLQADPSGAHTVAAQASSEVLVRRNAAQGARLRDLLSSIFKLPNAADQQKMTPADQRLPWSLAEARWRGVAAWSHRPVENDAVFSLRRLDIQNLLLWHAERYLDDFYGPTEEGGRAFFEVAAQDYLNAARRLAPDGPTTRDQFDAVGKMLAQRSEAARSGVELQASNVLLLGDVQNTGTSVSVVARPGQAAAGLPPGQATVFVGDRPGKIGSPHALQLPLTAEAAGETTDENPGAGTAIERRIDLSLTGPASAAALMSTEQSLLKAVALFRGNEFTADFPVSPLAGTRVDFVPQHRDEAQILLRGAERKQASVVFVLDCSSSMQAPMLLEEPSNTARRFDAARLGLVSLLEQLAQQGNARVGVIFYGHRVGWDPAQFDQVLRQTRYKRPIPAAQRPYDDVETALTLGRFDGAVAGPLFELMESLAPWGETPLYLALIEAARQFSADDDVNSRSIVVITDGVNNQFNPPPDKAKTQQDVLDALAGRQIAVHVVGFGIPADQSESARSAFTALSAATNGSYVPIAQASELIDYLEQLLGPSYYTVQGAAGQEAREALGTPVTVKLDSSERSVRRIAFGDAVASVRLTGGESLQLTTVSGGRGIESVRYERGAPRFIPLVDASGNSGGGFLLGIHRPLRQGDDVEFEFSLQQAQRHVVSRPAEVWVEVTAVMPNGSMGPRYEFYDAEYVVQTPVPVLKWTAGDWPEDSRQASIRFYCQQEPTQPATSVPAVISPSGPVASEAGAIPGVPSASVRVHTVPKENFEIQVVERYVSGVDVFPALRVDLVGPSKPERVIRVFDAEHRACLHRFVFPLATAQQLSAARVEIRNRESWQRSALQTPQPVLVELSVSSGLTVPAATGGGP